MSPSQREIRAQRAAAAEARRRAESEKPVPTVPAPAAGEVEQPQTSLPEPYRPQPFTPDLIPEPVEVDEAEGELTPQEADDLGHCEAAFANGNRAEWMKWKAAHAVRARRLYRQGGRTWPDYCEYLFGESESEVNRRIQQWPLLKAITEQQGQPRSIPDSHVQQLLPMVKQHDEELTARAYVALRGWAEQHKHRVTAQVVGGLVELARAAELPSLTNNTFQLAIEAKPKQPSTKPKVPAPAAPPAPTEPVGSHPNLGDHERDTTSGAPSEDEHQEAETEPVGTGSGVDERQEDDHGPLADKASHAYTVLEGLCMGFMETGLLRHARPDTLKGIAEAARSLAKAAEGELKSR